MNIVKRPARREDVINLVGRIPEQTLWATVWEVDGVVQGMAAYMKEGKDFAIVFHDWNEDVKVPAIRVWREAKAWMDEFKESYARCVAAPGSEKFLERLGWQHVETGPEGEIYEWQQ